MKIKLKEVEVEIAWWQVMLIILAVVTIMKMNPNEVLEYLKPIIEKIKFS
ncbi:hypothetical protein [Polaribacter cellanae]|uniref:Uncharacterized protein n=1 Tax=Polaribacter cellanae TaxID=2818493 RepID=A0A975CPZ1_9FLAO|nr:hypothetical protein [Polaribacter cellanae]QTE21033.1 hypothetical protein J3359_09235 [Polaribacter cellanae]QTE21041.1 hypothetical protein J3359_09280 [Polaribacter cellanae]QTE21050.1 hypothetical protein J3359_09330 [Polaribacter cellanae]